MNYLLIVTAKNEEYTTRYEDDEMLEVFGKDAWKNLQAGEIYTDKHGNKVIDMVAAARAAIKK